MWKFKILFPKKELAAETRVRGPQVRRVRQEVGPAFWPQRSRRGMWVPLSTLLTSLWDTTVQVAGFAYIITSLDPPICYLRQLSNGMFPPRHICILASRDLDLPRGGNWMMKARASNTGAGPNQIVSSSPCSSSGISNHKATGSLSLVKNFIISILYSFFKFAYTLLFYSKKLLHFYDLI